MVGSGQKVVLVPVPFAEPTFASFSDVLPWSKAILYSPPSRFTNTSTREDSALTTETPTPCKPPDTLYPSPPNLPPAWRMVKTTSTVGIFSFGCLSIGMPRPLSATVTELSGCIHTSILSQYPANASSTELSTTSYTRWCRPRGPVEPMYMPGRLRTASKPSRT